MKTVGVSWTLILHRRRNRQRLHRNQRMETPKSGVAGSWQHKKCSFTTRRDALTELAQWLGGNRRGGTGFLKGVIRATRAQKSPTEEEVADDRGWRLPSAGNQEPTHRPDWLFRRTGCSPASQTAQRVGRLPRLIQPLDNRSFLLTPCRHRSRCQGTSRAYHGPC